MESDDSFYSYLFHLSAYYMVFYLYLAAVSGLAPLFDRNPKSSYGKTMGLYLLASAVAVCVAIVYVSTLNAPHEIEWYQTVPVVFVVALVPSVLAMFQSISGYSASAWGRAIGFSIVGSLPMFVFSEYWMLFFVFSDYYMVFYLYLAAVSGLVPLFDRNPKSSYGKTMGLYLLASAVAVCVALVYSSRLNPLNEEEMLVTLPVVFVVALVASVLVMFQSISGCSASAWGRAIGFTIVGSTPMLVFIAYLIAFMRAVAAGGVQ